MPLEVGMLGNILMAGACGLGAFLGIHSAILLIEALWNSLSDMARERATSVLAFVFGPDVLPTDAILVVLFGNIVSIVVLLVLGIPLVFVIAAVCLGIFGPIVLYVRASTQHQRELELALPLALQQVANEMAAGATLETALKKVVMTAPKPADIEISRLQRRVDVMGVDAAFADMAERLNLRSFALTAAVVRVGTSSGGKLVEAIKALSRTLIEIERLNRKIRTASENGRRNLYLMSIIGPLVAFGAAFSVDHEQNFLDDSLGQLLIAVSIIFFIAAHFIGHRLTKVKV